MKLRENVEHDAQGGFESAGEADGEVSDGRSGVLSSVSDGRGNDSSVSCGSNTAPDFVDDVSDISR